MSQKTDAPLDTYEVNSSTIAVLPEPMNGKMYSKIIEKDCTFYVSMKPLQIVDRSCRYFGSSYAGRKAGTYEVINISHKPPIMVDLSNHIFLFPTLSSTRPQCGWISHVHVKEFKATEFDDTAVTFSNGKTMELPVSCNSFENQVYRTAWLRTKFQDRVEHAPKRQEFMLYPKEERTRMIYDFILRELGEWY
ncbi:competence protein [Bacillus atrophaeus]|uniref:competence protein ComK n=1 Tax=Bacillus atrophaeus TaxID=1452 RepID=UPI000D079654|nr:competence protein ComK [Bacillus atrophaeus]PSA92333.1 competence protein [Bacillus atrophaeus]